VKEASRMTEKTSRYYNQVASEQSIAASEEKKNPNSKSPKPERREDTPMKIVESSQDKVPKPDSLQNLINIHVKNDPHTLQRRPTETIKVGKGLRYEDSIKSPYLQINKGINK